MRRLLLCGLLVAGTHSPAPAALAPAALAPAASAASSDDPAVTVRSLQLKLRSPRPETRRAAVRALARIGSDEALALLASALADARGQVADEAQLRLLDFRPDRVLEQLSGPDGLRCQDPWVRRRAAEVLGRLRTEVPGKLLLSALDRRDPEVSAAVLVAVERLAAGGRLTGAPAGLQRLVRRTLGSGSADGVRARGLQALCAMDPVACAAALPGLERRAARQTRVSVLVARARLSLMDPGSQPDLCERIRGALADEDPAVRAAAAALAGRGFADHGVVSSLVDRLEAEPRPAVAASVARALRAATGLKHGTHVRAWRHAVGEELGPGWLPSFTARVPELGSLGEDPARDRAGGRMGAATVASTPLGALEPMSDRLAILVDFSGSLWNERPDGTTRKERLDPEVDGLLGRLLPETELYLAAFTGDLHPFTPAPVRATRARVRDARSFFRRARMRGKGDAYLALLAALEHPAIDRVLLVTDGAPTGGRRWNVEVIVDRLLERTRFRPVTFDVVLHGAGRGARRRWGRLAERTGGRLVVVDESR